MRRTSQLFPCRRWSSLERLPDSAGSPGVHGARDFGAQRGPCTRRAEDPERLEARDLAHVVGFPGVLSVPMLREDSPIGAITVWRATVGPFSDRHIALLETFASQAVLAIENVRLFQELRARTAELGGLSTSSRPWATWAGHSARRSTSRTCSRPSSSGRLSLRAFSRPDLGVRGAPGRVPASVRATTSTRRTLRSCRRPVG